MLEEITIPDATIRDEKYVVFKRSDLADLREYFKRNRNFAPHLDAIMEKQLDDAVVIRTQDIFAGPALHGYAAALAIAVRVWSFAPGHEREVASLQSIADYFHERAVEADEGPRKIPD